MILIVHIIDCVENNGCISYCDKVTKQSGTGMQYGSVKASYESKDIEFKMVNPSYPLTRSGSKLIISRGIVSIKATVKETRERFDIQISGSELRSFHNAKKRDLLKHGLVTVPEICDGDSFVVSESVVTYFGRVPEVNIKSIRYVVNG